MNPTGDHQPPRDPRTARVLGRALIKTHRWRPRRGRRRNQLPELFTVGIVLAVTTLTPQATGTWASWTDTTQITGTAMSADTLAPPTTLAVSQSCVADPAPARRSGAGGASFTNGTDSGTLTIAKPSSAEAGDVLIAAVAWFGNHTSTSPTPPAGWTLIRRVGDNTIGLFSYYRLVGASEPTSYTWQGQAESSAGGIAAYTGVDTTAPIDTHGGQNNQVSGQVTAPSITTTRDNALLIGAFGIVHNSPLTSPPSMSPIFSAASTGPGAATQAVSMLVAQEPWPTPGATGPRTATGTGARSAGQLIALQPPARPYATTTWTPSVSSYASAQDFRRSSGDVLQRQATLGSGSSSQTDGPLVPGASYTIALHATYENWVSPTSTTAFTARSC